jgi:sigma-54-specific transcriptional regulator
MTYARPLDNEATPGNEPDTVLREQNLLAFAKPHEFSMSVRAKALVFQDPASKQLLSRIERLAPSNANILILGATGTGKELVARFVHSRSNRRDKPFVALNCGAISRDLIESELFGHERGAFTGAHSAKAGWFETASGGTLFLDEMGDLPLAQQVKLLRVLQEGEVVRVGSRRPIPVDVRLIAATNVDLVEAVTAGRFREDLYYRLKVGMLHLPSLRERVADIPALLQHFIQYYSERLGLSGIGVSDATMEALKNYPWPGNIRELENAVHQAILVCHGNSLQLADFSLPHLSLPPAAEAVDRSQLEEALRAIYAGNKPEGVSVDDYIEETIVRSAFAYCNQNQSATARMLGITRNIIRTRLLRFGMIEDRYAESADEDN